MRRLAEALHTLAITLWVGGLFTIGYLVVPVLFSQLGDRAMAASLAGELFKWLSWVGFACAAYLLLFLSVRRGAASVGSGEFRLVLAMLILTCAGHFGVAPVIAQLKAEAMPLPVMESVLRDRFIAWHGVSRILYLAESLLGVWLVLLQSRDRK